MTQGAFNGWKVVAAALDGKPAHSGAFRTDGVRFYTYAVQLAHIEHDTIVLDVPEDWSYSATSNKHFNCLLTEIHSPGFAVRMSERRDDRDRARRDRAYLRDS